MKRILFVILSACLLWTCSKVPGTVSVVKCTDTGCGKEVETRSGDDSGSVLLLEYSKDGLVITRTNAEMNCSVKNGGVVCDLSVNGNVITLDVYEKDRNLLRCLCPVEKMTQTIAGLSLDTDYILDYRCGGNFYSPISFRYEKGLSQFFDLYARYVDFFDVK